MCPPEHLCEVLEAELVHGGDEGQVSDHKVPAAMRAEGKKGMGGGRMERGSGVKRGRQWEQALHVGRHS